jgi:hypothetical protein
MIVAGFFQRDNETKKIMNAKFKEKGFNLAEKRVFIERTLGYTAYMKDMTISEKEEVIEALSAQTVDEQ